MRRSALPSALVALSAAWVAAGCGPAPRAPKEVPVAVRIEALLPLHPAWRDYLALTESPARSTPQRPGAGRPTGAPLPDMPTRLVYDIPAVASTDAGLPASNDRIEELRPSYERRNAAFYHSALRQRLRELEAVRGPISAALARSDALAEALYASQWNEQVAPTEAKVLALQSQLDAWSSDRAVRSLLQPEMDRLRKAADEADARLKLELALRRAQGAQRVIDARDRETEAIRQELVLLEAERNAEVGRQISGYKRDVARSRQSIQPLTNTVVPRPVVATPPELRDAPRPVLALTPPREAAPRSAPRVDAARLLGLIRRDLERRVQRVAEARGWRPVYGATLNLPDRTDEVRRLLAQEDRT